ncbi:protein of unknown function [Pseudomonas sp. JV551A1]|uniref:Uncharacterized protein n=1 Tax=Pseudomonas inefficax TaxID=2078786 RepID=A0AAQ1SUX5_9PSED|nr:protein of unknown function [Pseudomonas sp. JV551A1]SPO61677.1 protein of unknown function [Pseudomonas inefficax]
MLLTVVPASWAALPMYMKIPFLTHQKQEDVARFYKRANLCTSVKGWEARLDKVSQQGGSAGQRRCAARPGPVSGWRLPGLV